MYYANWTENGNSVNVLKIMLGARNEHFNCICFFYRVCIFEDLNLEFH